MRRIGLVLLSVYTGLLVVAAWPPEAQPAAVRLPSALASAGLRSLGIRPGVAVFEAGREPGRRVTRNDCVRVRGFPVDGGAPQLLHPPDGHCFTEGTRWSLPWQEGLLRSLLLRSPAPEAAIGDWACHGPRHGGAGYERIDVLWSQPWVDLGTGEEGIWYAAWFVWRYEPAGLLSHALRPTEDDLRQAGTLP